MEGGWIPVLSQKGRTGWRRKANAKLFTIFVDDLPRSMNVKMMVDIFRKFGVVKDVYIPQKRRKVRNTRFAFVRYDCEVAAEVAVKKANGLWVEDKQLVVKHADYGKVTLEDKIQYPPKPNGPPYTGKGVSSVWKPTVGFRSYAEVTKNTSVMGDGIVSIKAEEIGNGWLHDSVVVRLKSEYANLQIQKEIQERGMQNVVVRNGGGRDVLLTFTSKECREASMGTVKEWLGDWCEEIVEWKPDLVRTRERKVWLCCYGIPWNLWNRATLNRIGNIWGEVICIEGDLCNPASFECAKIQIITRCMEPINKAVNLECEGSFQSVRVWELQSGIPNITAVSCDCSKKYGGEEVCSSINGEKLVKETVSDEAVEDDDGADESAQKLHQATDVFQRDGSCQVRSSDAVDMELPGCSETVVVESAENVLKGKTGSMMKAAGNIGNGCGGVGQKSLDQVVTHGVVRSLSGSSLLKPGVHLEVALGLGNEVGLRNGLENMKKGVEAQAQGLKSGFQSGLQHAVGPLIICSDVSQTQNDAARLSSELQKKKGRKRVVKHSSGKKIKQMKNELAKSCCHKGASSSKLGPKGAIWRAAAMAASGSALTVSGVARNRTLLKEANETLQMGKLLGINYKGNEEVVLSRIMDLEAKDRERMGGEFGAAA